MLHISFTLLNLIAQSTYEQAATQAIHLEAKYGIEAELLLAIATVESGMRPHAVGASHKEVGLMQLRPKYFPKAKFDIKDNMELATRHLLAIKPACKKKYGKAWFVCYNIGQNRKLTGPATSLTYYKKVSTAYAKETKRLRDTLRIASGKSKNIIAQAP